METIERIITEARVKADIKKLKEWVKKHPKYQKNNKIKNHKPNEKNCN